MQRILIADVETTGLNPNLDKIIELSFAEIDENFNVINNFSVKVNPQRSICPAASAVHGIIDMDVIEAPLLTEALQPFGKNYFDDVFLIAHNAQFDRKFLDHYWNIQGIFCTLHAARRLYPDAPNHKLQTLRFFLGLDTDRDVTAHSAEGDVEVLTSLLLKMVTDSGTSLPDFVDLMLEPVEVASMPFGKYAGCSIEGLPKNYVRWLLTLPNLDSDLETSLKKL